MVLSEYYYGVVVAGPDCKTIINKLKAQSFNDALQECFEIFINDIVHLDLDMNFYLFKKIDHDLYKSYDITCNLEEMFKDEFNFESSGDST